MTEIQPLRSLHASKIDMLALLLRFDHLLRRGMWSCRNLLRHARLISLHLVQEGALGVASHLLVGSRSIILAIDDGGLIEIALRGHVGVWALLDELLLVCLRLVVHVN